jgi:hypothetical protein
MVTLKAGQMELETALQMVELMAVWRAAKMVLWRGEREVEWIGV